MAGIIRGTYPFGSVSRSTNDLGAQYVPFYAHLWDIVHGQAQGDLFFNWQSGFGVGFWGDFGVVLGSPLSLLVALFPRDQIDLAVFVLTTLKLALAAAAMVVLLRKMRPGPAWLAAALGASYGMCGWAIDDAAYVPMWLDGLIALPMFCLVGEWSLQALTAGGQRRTNRLLSVLVIGLFWFSNFYTAYMATIAGGLVLLARVLTSDLSWFRRLRVLLRHAVSVLLGMALAAPLLIPVFTANRRRDPVPVGLLHAPPARQVPVPADAVVGRRGRQRKPVRRNRGAAAGPDTAVQRIRQGDHPSGLDRDGRAARGVVPLVADADVLARVRHPERQPVPRGVRALRRAGDRGLAVVRGSCAEPDRAGRRRGACSSRSP